MVWFRRWLVQSATIFGMGGRSHVEAVTERRRGGYGWKTVGFVGHGWEGGGGYETDRRATKNGEVGECCYFCIMHCRTKKNAAGKSGGGGGGRVVCSECGADW